jgi:hypothetical protein
MREILTCGSMSGERKRDAGQWPIVPAPLLDSTNTRNISRHFCQGHSKKAAGYGGDGLGAIFAEVLTCLAYAQSASADHRQDQIAQARRRPATATHAAAVLVHRHIADVVQPVLDTPVGAHQRQQASGRCPGCIVRRWPTPHFW